MSKSLLRTNPVQLDTHAWSIEEIYSVPEASFASEMSSLWARIPAVAGVPASGRFAPRAVGMPTNWHYFGQGKHRVVAQYRTLSNEEYMDRFPSKGIVQGRSAVRSENIKYDINGTLVHGIVPTDTTGRTVRKIVSGPRSVRRDLMGYRVHAIVDSKSIWIDQYTERLGMVNRTSMINLSRHGAGRGELLFSGLSFVPRPYDKSKFTVDYDFLWTGIEDVPWNKLTWARQFERIATQVPFYNTDGEDTSETKTVYTLMPTDTWDYAPMYKEHNFSMINNLCNW